MRRDSSFCAKSVRYNIFTNGAPYTHPRSFACQGRLRNLGKNCSTIGLYCVAITWQLILQRFTPSCGNRCFAAFNCWTQASWQVMQRDSYCW